MNKIKFISILLVLISICTKTYSKENVFIIYNINNELITNIDVKKESTYLIALNVELKNLDEKKILEISKESILRETIKKIELEKFFDLNERSPIIGDYIEKFYLRLNLSSEIEFQEYLQSYGLSINFIKEKITIETMWNQLIFNKYKNVLKVDEVSIRKKIQLNKDKASEKQYFLSEIIFDINNQNEFSKKKNNIDKSIKEIGFKNSAGIYSISDSSKFGGEIGWIDEKQLSKKIFSLVSNLKIGEYTQPINTGSTYLILKIDDIKYEKKKINIDQEISKKIRIETDRQLQQYSKIYYNRVKINTIIDEL
jgi:peptidyl-prolyl cis-trans isomerase SurA